MDRTAQGRRRPPGAQPASKPPVRLVRDKKSTKELAPRPAPGKIREAKDSSEIIRVPKRVEAIAAERPSAERRSTDDDPNARQFTVANVGRNGTVYLKPSRFQVPMNQKPATPPGTADGKEEIPLDWAGRRPSAMSGTWTPRLPPPRGSTMNTTMPMPPLSMANGHDRRRARSHSFSPIDAARRSPTFDSNDFQILVNGRESGRPKSSVDLTDGILDLRIPHYKLGTPRFSDRGTAYLHNSMYTSNSEDMRSSVFSRAEYDKLFPAPPGKEHTIRTRNSSSPYLHPSHATHSLAPSRTPPTPKSSSPLGDINYTVYDKVEARLNDATLVRYSPATGRIIAATPARLIAQITSPLFLDYELLADFFLTYRSFISSSELLEYMLARMKWALSNDSDAGRIVRVRTFVALRHWILNYFSDDFIPILELRQRFCTLVNQLTQNLRHRQDRGGTDINVIGELKKCWRRTCAGFWPVPNALDTSPDADILPGQPSPTPGYSASSISLPLSVRPRQSQLDFRRSSVIRLPPDIEKDVHVNFAQPTSPETPMQHARTASIPTSPMSEDSMTVLSCSVPFLRNIMPGRDKAARPAELHRNPPHERSSRPNHGHKRSGSFSDALRDNRPPLPSAQPDGIDLRSLQSLTFTGGLVRGLLLQPSPSTVELLIPLSPAMDVRTHGSSGTSDSYFHEQQLQSVGMKRLVGDVRRALSSRRPHHDSPASSHRSTNSSDSRSSGNVGVVDRSSANPTSWQQLSGPPRVDMLAERIESAYKDAFDDAEVDMEKQRHATLGAAEEEDFTMKEVEVEGRVPSRQMRRLDSHVTTGSRSIVIVDDTGIPDIPNIGALPSVSSWQSGMAPKALFRSPAQAYEEWQGAGSYHRSGSATAVASEGQRVISGEPNMHDLLAVPWHTEPPDGEISVGYDPARKSSDVNPSAFELQPARNQLRRRPGGDLKAADHVHDLEPAPKHHHGDSYSTITRSIPSDTPPHMLSGTHFSGQGYNGWQVTQPIALLPTHSSEPNMRASFEQQVSHLKQLPEGQQEEGGIEDALAKLEGKKSSGTMRDSNPGIPPLPQIQQREGPRSSSVQFARVSAPGKHTDSADGSQVLSPMTDRQGASIYRLSGSEAESEQMMGRPILRALNPDSITTATSNDCAIESVDFTDYQSTQVAHGAQVRDTEKIRKVESPEVPKFATPQGSFLLDDNESLSDISTEIADQSEDDSLGVRSFFFDDTPADEFVPTFAPYRPPPTPPPTIGPSTNSMTSEPSARMLASEVPDKKTLKEAQSAPKLLPSTKQDPRFQQTPGELRRVHTAPSQKQVAHLPFVLAFESDVIAEQFTIIEKDALDEVEWQDLVSLNWQQSPPVVRNWVEYLQHESNGIDIVTARFNLVVKWVVSECMLTEAPSERARCITKYIHIAASCHRLRNYASMYQITLALLSADMARLHQTWTLVAPAEKTVLERLEKLCQPVRNFHNLRSEMEAVSAEEGCIPFIGLYTHDLMFNAQKPSTFDPLPPGKEKLVNFERYQTAATIVKSLLRLIEASSKYIFRPHPEVLSRCLWLAALEDAEITARSKTLET